jgi:bifunctional non-homologous end joining protein LigD
MPPGQFCGKSWRIASMTMISPMLATSGSLPADSEKWSYEVKWDGFRAFVEASPDGVTITSRNGYDMTTRYPELEGLAHAVSMPMLLDGEIVALDGNGMPDFAALWFRSRGSASDIARVCFMAFDVLELGEDTLIDRSYRERRGILESLALSGSHWCTPEIHVGEGAALFAHEAHGSGGGRRQASRLAVPAGGSIEGLEEDQVLLKRTFALLGWLPPGSGVRIVAVSCSASALRRGSRCPESWSRGTTEISWSSCRS